MKFNWCEKSRALRIGWMMEELGLPYERIRVDIRDNDAKRDADFLAASPLSKVPALVDGETKRSGIQAPSVSTSPTPTP